ncbi:MAG TPA: hypothetical protein VGK53_09185, partial [Propionicimonas sp.]
EAFIYRGVAGLWILPAIAVLTTPTRAEINAGTSLVGSLAGVGGFAIENQVKEVAPVGATFVEQTPGANKVTAPCTLTLYEKRTATALRIAVAVGTVGYILIAPYGDIVGKRAEVWPGQVATLAPTWDSAGAAVFRMVWAVRSAPTQNAVMPS